MLEKVVLCSYVFIQYFKEHFKTEFLRGCFPSTYYTDSIHSKRRRAIIIKNEKEKSHEMDIIVYNKELPLYDGKPPFISGEFAIVSPDCVKVVIQVKRYITSPKDFDSIKDNLDSAYLLNPKIKKYLVAGWHPSKKTLQAYKDQFRNKSIKYFTFWKDGTWNSINIEGFQEFFSNIDYDLNNN